jgi:UDP-N-acetylenolpyruvoylglucosamine reductase
MIDQATIRGGVVDHARISDRRAALLIEADGATAGIERDVATVQLPA